MLGALDIQAILIAVFAVLGISLVSGLVFGLGMSSDALRGIENRERLSSDEIDKRVEEGLDATLHSSRAQIQLLPLSGVAAAIGGALAVLFADQRPLLQAGVVAVILGGLELLPYGDLPPRLRILAAVVSPAGAMIAAYALV